MNTSVVESKTVALAPFNAISMALSMLLEKWGIRVTKIFDNNKKVQGNVFRGIPVYSAGDVDLKAETVIVCSFISLKQIAKQLVQLGARSVIEYEEIVNRDDLNEMLAAFEEIKSNGDLDNINEYHKNVMFCSGDLSIRAALLPSEANKGVVLPLTTVVLTELCTLRCAECSHLMQYFTKPRTYDIETILKNFDALYQATSFIRIIGVSGGEPLLHERVAEIIERLAAYENIGYISLTTNGTVLPEESFFERVSKYSNLNIRLSDYGEHSKHRDAIAQKCKEYGIRHAVLSSMTWYGGLRISEINGNAEDVGRVFTACSTKDMLLAEHSFAKCHLALFADKLGAIPKGLPGIGSCLDVSDDGFSADALREYLESEEPMQSCSICTGVSRTREQVPPAEQLSTPLTYKRYDTPGHPERA